jgi:hypothetical protein
MNVSTGDNMKAPKKRAKETGTLVGVRLQSADLSRLDAFIKAQPSILTRPQAIREILKSTFKLIDDDNAAIRRTLSK